MAHAPENTLASLEAAVACGATWVEFDVMLTGDDVPVLFHDDSLKRTTGVDGLMAETAYAEAEKLDAGAWFAPRFAGERVPTLEAAIAALLAAGAHPNVELKPSSGRDVETAVEALRVLERCWPDDRPAPFISSFSRLSLAAARALKPDWPRGFIAWEVPEDWAEALTALGCTSFHVHQAYLSPELAAEVKAAGHQLASYTVNDAETARELAAWGVDAFISDAPERILSGAGA